MEISLILPPFFPLFQILRSNINGEFLSTLVPAWFSNNCMSGVQIRELIEVVITFHVWVLKAYDNEY